MPVITCSEAAVGQGIRASLGGNKRLTRSSPEPEQPSSAIRSLLTVPGQVMKAEADGYNLGAAP